MGLTSTQPDRHACFNVCDFGADPTGRQRTTDAIQAAIDHAAEQGGGTVVFPAGVYLIAPIQMRSRITLQLEPGSTLRATDNIDEFPLIPGRWEGKHQPTYASVIYGHDLDDIAIVGRGTIDGSGAAWWKLHRSKTLKAPRPRLIGLSNCRNVRLDGFRATNSPSWTIHPVRCENLTIHALTVENPADSPNTDGINPDSCRNVHISNCHVDVGDDCVTIKAGTEEDDPQLRAPCENITITNCTMVHGHGGVVIGSEMSGDVRNVTISNCVFDGTDRGIRLKTRRGRGGVIEDIRASNIVMRDVLCPFVINLFYGCGAWDDPKVLDKHAYPVDESTPAIRRVYLSNISARGVKLAAGFIQGLPERDVEQVVFQNISVSLDPTHTRPGDPAMAPGLEPCCRAGFVVNHASDVRFSTVDVDQHVGPAFKVAHCHRVSFTAAIGHGQDPHSPMFVIDDAPDTRIDPATYGGAVVSVDGHAD